MTAIQLTPAQRKEHRAEAHHLDPVVMIGNDGVTPAVKKEIDLALNAHGLIKVRVFSDDRTAREATFNSLAEELGAAPIQHIGKLLVLWRPMPPKEKVEREGRKAGPKIVSRMARSSENTRTLIRPCAFSAASISFWTAGVSPSEPTITTGSR